MQMSLVSAGPPPLFQLGLFTMSSPHPARLALAHYVLCSGAVTYPPGEAGAERRGWWGRGMARCAAQGGWHKRRRRGRRKKLGKESSGREGSGIDRVFELGCWHVLARTWGRALGPQLRSLATPGREEWGWGVGEGSRDGHVECRLWRRLRWQRGAQARRRGRGGAGVLAAPRSCFHCPLSPHGALVPAPKGVGRGCFFP